MRVTYQKKLGDTVFKVKLNFKPGLLPMEMEVYMTTRWCL